MPRYFKRFRTATRLSSGEHFGPRFHTSPYFRLGEKYQFLRKPSPDNGMFSITYEISLRGRPRFRAASTTAPSTTGIAASAAGSTPSTAVTSTR